MGYALLGVAALAVALILLGIFGAGGQSADVRAGGGAPSWSGARSWPTSCSSPWSGVW
jgi:hypothetical protein